MPRVSPDQEEARRRQIVKAAFKRFSRQGIRGTALLSICREARMSIGTLYRAFGSKEEIVAAVAEESCRRDLALIQKLLEASEGEPERVKTLLSAERLAQLGTQAETRLRIELWAEALYDPALAEIVRRGMDDITEVIERAIQEVESNVDFRQGGMDEARALAFLWNGSSPWKILSDLSYETGKRSQSG